ncbi:MAG TPA: metallophosphoesterase family protein [Actinomycetota bacterium]|nr:metallophosphoesterase family protein [Actinomycetota bacterium]
MLLGFISDVHANLPALEAVLDDVDGQQLDALICLGDLVGYGASPNEVIDLVSDKADVSLAGNHDLAAVGSFDLSLFNLHARASAEWTSKELTSANVSLLSSLRSQREVFGLSVAHASIKDPVSEYVSNPQVAAENFAIADFDIAVVGHTHVPAVFALMGQFVTGERIPHGRTDLTGQRSIVNPGSVGQPRDGEPRASWATFDSSTSIFEVRRVEYDVRRAQEAIIRAGLPKFLATRLEEGM